MRADARLNRERILSAAQDAIIEHGPEVSLDVIAARAGVGIGTFYRRFPNRTALFQAVVASALGRIVEEEEQAIAEAGRGWATLERYLHRALDLRVGAVIPMLVEHVSFEDPETRHLRDRSAALIQQIIDGAQREGTLRPDVTFADISLLLIRLSRPLTGPFSRTLQDELARRHLELVLDGLRVRPDATVAPLPQPALTLDELRSLEERPAAHELPDPSSTPGSTAI
jgi:AcrR family transcriptional regulator